jgi:Protein of unknown function (DUF3592)
MRIALCLLFGTFVGCALYSIIFHDTSGPWHTATHLLRDGEQIVGTVTAKEPMNHASVRYDYSVDGQRYSGGPCGVSSNFDKIHVGDPIAVTYSRESPSVSVCGDANSAYSSSWGALFVVTPAFCLLAGILSAFTLHHYLRQIPPNSSNQALQPTAGHRDV